MHDRIVIVAEHGEVHGVDDVLGRPRRLERQRQLAVVCL